MRTTYVYILSSPSRRLHVGYTDDIRRDIFMRRAEAPNDPPFTLVYYETLPEQRQAIDRYIALKKLPTARKRRVIEVFNPLWEDLSREWLWGKAN